MPAQQDKATLSFILLPKNLGSIVFYLQMLSINAFLAQHCEALSRSEQISRVDLTAAQLNAFNNSN
jgi:hypothetical protein